MELDSEIEALLGEGLNDDHDGGSSTIEAAMAALDDQARRYPRW